MTDGRGDRSSLPSPLLEAIVEEVPAMIFVKEAADLRFVTLNRAGEALLGMPREDLVGRSDRDFFPAEQADFFIGKDREVLAGPGVIDIPEEPIQTAAGERWLHTRKLALPGPDGAPAYLLGVSFDITEARAQRAALEQANADLRAARVALEQEQARLGLLLEHFPGAVFRTDEQLRVVDASGAALVALGAPEYGAELSWWLPEVAAAAGQARRGGGGRAEFRRGHAWFEVSMTWRADGLLGVAIDVTERRRVVDAALQQRLEQTQKLELLGVLAGGIAHDFNNLLAGVLGHTSLALLELDRQAPARRSLHHAEACAERAAELTRQLLAYSGRSRFVVERVDLNDLVREMAGLLRVSIGKSVKLDLRLADDLPYTEVDVAQIRQLVLNLITNASDAIGPAPGTIELTTTEVVADDALLQRNYLHADLEPGPFVALKVRDDGCGMSPEIVQRMFDPFFTTKADGHGLGLAATLGIVKGHRGAVFVQSQPGQGTTIEVLLPPSGPPLTLSGSAPAFLDESLPPGTGVVLVVDDEATVRALARSVLERAGYEVHEAVDGVDALERFPTLSDRLSLVLLDMTMPRLDGEATFRELRRIAPRLPVLLSSGYSEQEVRGRFHGGSPNGFLQKPYRAQDLVATVQAMLAGWPG